MSGCVGSVKGSPKASSSYHGTRELRRALQRPKPGSPKTTAWAPSKAEAHSACSAGACHIPEYPTQAASALFQDEDAHCFYSEVEVLWELLFPDVLWAELAVS